jgi:CHAT domain-containing protein
VPPTPEPAASPAVLSTFAVEAPTQARTLVWERLLADWGAATLAGDSGEAVARLSAASAIGSVLATRYGDSSVTDALRAIERVAGDHARTRQLAAAHRRFGQAQIRARLNDFRAADSGFVAVMEESPPSPALRRWSMLGHGNALIYQRRPDDAERTMHALIENGAADRDPAVGARAVSTLGVLRLRHGQTESGLEAVRDAARRFARLGERENLGAMVSVEGEVRMLAGDAARGYAGLHRALVELRRFPSSVWRHNALFLLARAAAADGLTRAAAALEDEDAAVSTASGLAESVAEFRLTRARALWSSGRPDEARAALAAATRAVDTLRSADSRAQFQAELNLTTAMGPLRSEPARAYLLLDSVIAFFAPLRNPAKLVPAYVARAEAALALERVAAAETDLDSAARMYDPRRREIAGIPQRALLLARAQSVLDRLVMVRLRGGRVSDALEALERGRLSFAPVAATGEVAARSSAVGAMQRTVDYTLIGDTLLAWVVTGRDTTLERSVIDRNELLSTIERARAGLELGSPAEVIRPELSRLYDWLVRRIEDRFGGDAARPSIAIVTDEEIGDVPFSALYDERRAGYLVERYATRFATTLHQSQRLHGATRPQRALVVASPVVDARTFPGLRPLARAEGEARSIASLYDGSALLVGAAADSAAVASALGDAALLHFAGHAVFDNARPERSFLALAPRGLSASAISALDLRRLRLAVLSACETTRSSARSSSGFVGLTEAFLAAGAGGVVGSLWRVDDVHADTLMRVFHHGYSRSGDAAGSLRAAQLALLRSASPELRSPSAWAAFRYVGR